MTVISTPPSPADPGLLRRGWADLVAGSRCVGCDRGGPVLCAACRATLPARAHATRPDPCPPGLVPVHAAAPYGGLVRDLVLHHKERGLVALGRDLGLLLARAVGQGAPARAGPLLLVPVPSRRSATRARGHDPTRAVVRHAAARLRAAGRPAHVVGVLALRGVVADQAGLDAGQRAATLAGSLWCPTAGVRRLVRAHPRGLVVLCDDVLTTGATLREAQRALTSAGLAPVAAATVAATVRRRPAAPPRDVAPRVHTQLSGPGLAWVRPTH